MARHNHSLSIPCLAYHRIHASAPPTQAALKAFSIDVGIFREQLAALESAGYSACPLSDLLRWRQNGCQPPERPVIITFDDGWASNLLLAQPELRRYQMPWTIFAVADPRAALFEEGSDIDRALANDEIAQLSAAGVAIESHGLSHRPFTELQKDELDWELHESRARLEALTQQPVEWIAAPFGLANGRVVAAIQEAGYHGLACGLIGANTISQDRMIRLRRVAARPHWSGERLLKMLSPRALTRAALVGNLKRSLRLTLGHTWSSRLRRLVRSRT